MTSSRPPPPRHPPRRQPSRPPARPGQHARLGTDGDRNGKDDDDPDQPSDDNPATRSHTAHLGVGVTPTADPDQTARIRSGISTHAIPYRPGLRHRHQEQPLDGDQRDESLRTRSRGRRPAVTPRCIPSINPADRSPR
jgi:hypothetical protein